MIDRIRALHSLIQFAKPIGQLKHDFSNLPFDSNVKLAILKQAHLIKTLGRYRDGDLSGDDVEEWANLIEGREDIGVEGGRQGQARECLHELANPLLTTPLTRERAQILIRDIQNREESG